MGTMAPSILFKKKKKERGKERCNPACSCSKCTYRYDVALNCDFFISFTDLSLASCVYTGKEYLNIESERCFIFDCSPFIHSSYMIFLFTW